MYFIDIEPSYFSCSGCITAFFKTFGTSSSTVFLTGRGTELVFVTGWDFTATSVMKNVLCIHLGSIRFVKISWEFRKGLRMNSCCACS